MDLHTAKMVGLLVASAMTNLGAYPSDLHRKTGLTCKDIRQIRDGVPNQSGQRIRTLVRKLQLSKKAKKQILQLLSAEPKGPTPPETIRRSDSRHRFRR